MEVAHGLQQLLRPLGWLLLRLDVPLQILDEPQGSVDVAVPEVPLQALQLLVHRGHVQSAILVLARF